MTKTEKAGAMARTVKRKETSCDLESMGDSVPYV
jgi:hypothetical protein